jgi:hypothetical protein
MGYFHGMPLRVKFLKYGMNLCSTWCRSNRSRRFSNSRIASGSIGKWVEIPLSSETPGVIRKLSNGKLEIIVDADQPFDEWLASLESRITTVMQE